MKLAPWYIPSFVSIHMMSKFDILEQCKKKAISIGKPQIFCFALQIPSYWPDNCDKILIAC